MKKPVKFFSGRASRKLAEQIAKAYGSNLGKESVVEFSDGEFEPSFDETIRGAEVFLIQSTLPPSENLMELLLMIDAAKRASAHNIILESLVRPIPANLGPPAVLILQTFVFEL